MGCACKNKGSKQSSMSVDITLEPVTLATDAGKDSPTSSKDITADTVVKSALVESRNTTEKLNPSIKEAQEIGLKQCYLCAKKHVQRAMDFFEEYHNGYPDYIKNLIESVRVSESDVMRAFLRWQRVMGQLNMGEGELLGRDINRVQMRDEHTALADKIRKERLKLSDDPLYIPDFESLLVAIHELQHKVMNNII